MSEAEIESIHTESQSFDNEYKTDKNCANLVVQIIDSSVFKIMLKDLVSSMYTKEHENQEREKEGERRLIELESLVEEIGNELLIVATTEANKQVKETEKFLAEMYEHKVKELENRFEELIDKKIKEVEERMQHFENTQIKYSSESLVHRAIHFPTKDKYLIEANEQELKRLQLKEKILNSTSIQETRSSLKLDGVASSLLSSTLENDGVIEKLSEKVKLIEENFKAEFKLIIQKVALVRTQTKIHIEQSEADIKEQLNNGFEGIWNVISNLEKRMTI